MPSTISAGTTAGTALNFTSDTTGNLAFQTNGTTTAMTIDTSQNVTFANNVTYSGTITATTGFSGNGAGLTAINASNVSSGTLASARLPTSGVNAASITTGTLAVANGGTGLSATPTNGQLDIGNGSGFSRATLTAGSGISITNGAGSISIAATGGGTVTSVATGNGLSGGTITTTGTLVIAAPSYNSVGSYVFAYMFNDGGASISNQGNYSGGGGARQVQAGSYANYGDADNRSNSNNNLSGTWRWVSASIGNGGYNAMGLAVRIS